MSEELLVRAVRVETWKENQRCTNASGFFFLNDGYLFLMTNRHVVIDDSIGHHPDEIRFLIHTSKSDLTKNETVVLPLYTEGKPNWREHPSKDVAVDIVAVPISDPMMLCSHYVDAFTPDEIFSSDQVLPPGQSVLVVAFPLGFNDTFHNLPIIRQAVVASDFSHPFKNQPYFLTDARMHRGTSGAPVVARLKCATEVAGRFEEKWRLLGIHSAAIDVSDRDPQQDDRLGLNCTWYADLIPQILQQEAAILPVVAESTPIEAPAIETPAIEAPPITVAARRPIATRSRLAITS